jgi:hypothetical protein
MKVASSPKDTNVPPPSACAASFTAMTYPLAAWIGVQPNLCDQRPLDSDRGGSSSSWWFRGERGLLSRKRELRNSHFSLLRRTFPRPGQSGARRTAPLRRGFDTGTTIAVCASAAIIAAFYALTLVRLWRRGYRRHHYRVPVALGGWVATSDDAGADEIVARTKDISFGGASLVLARSTGVGRGVLVRSRAGLSSVGGECRRSWSRQKAKARQAPAQVLVA